MIKHVLAAALLTSLAFVTVTDATAQDALPRRILFGASPQATPDGAVQIGAVRAGSTAEAAGLAVGDVLQRINGQPVAAPLDLATAVRGSRAGQTLTLDVLRDGAPQTITARLAEAPRETPSDLIVTYESVRVGDALRRTLITAPRGPRQRRPAMLIIGGIGCYSIDDTSVVHDPYRTLAYDLARRGIIVMRLEKSGLGDSQGAPCPTVDFHTELSGYDAALAALRADRRVDPNQVFVFGHSIGSVGAPQLGQRHSAAGVIVAQGFGRSWIEYELINTRRQLELMGATPAETDDAMIWKSRCLGRILLAREPAPQVFEQTPECRSVVALPASQDYMAQLTEINVAEIWTALTSPALIIYGDSDFVTDLPDHQRLADLVNGAHPGNATLTVIEDLDHYIVRTESQASSLDRVAAGQSLSEVDPRFSATIGDWMCARARCTG